MLMTPPQLHRSLEESFSAGLPDISTVGHPGTHGAVVTGIQGMGVSTPHAAAVAAATWGLAREEHIPKGKMFFIGILSIMVAAGKLDVSVLFSGVTTSAEGVMPKLH